MMSTQQCQSGLSAIIQNLLKTLANHFFLSNTPDMMGEKCDTPGIILLFMFTEGAEYQAFNLN